jgi:conjugative relaxase-like TrwC/TraI family protein
VRSRPQNRGVHGFDLTFCAPKSVSLIRALKADDVADKAILNAHNTAISEAMEYLATHAGYTRVHNAVTGELCDTTEMADALNRRIHHDTIGPAAPTIGVALRVRVS